MFLQASNRRKFKKHSIILRINMKECYKEDKTSSRCAMLDVVFDNKMIAKPKVRLHAFFIRFENLIDSAYLCDSTF